MLPFTRAAQPNRMLPRNTDFLAWDANARPSAKVWLDAVPMSSLGVCSGPVAGTARGAAAAACLAPGVCVAASLRAPA